MRKFLLAASCVGAVSLAVLAPSAAQARDYPYCIKGFDYDSSVGDCSFDTYEQCQASASGRPSYCDANPFYANRQPVAPPVRRRGQY
jgi:hypothetical protein